MVRRYSGHPGIRGRPSATPGRTAKRVRHARMRTGMARQTAASHRLSGLRRAIVAPPQTRSWPSAATRPMRPNWLSNWASKTSRSAPANRPSAATSGARAGCASCRPSRPSSSSPTASRSSTTSTLLTIFSYRGTFDVTAVGNSDNNLLVGNNVFDVDISFFKSDFRSSLIPIPLFDFIQLCFDNFPLQLCTIQYGF